jgi:hypothetical protein
VKPSPAAPYSQQPTLHRPQPTRREQGLNRSRVSTQPAQPPGPSPPAHRAAGGHHHHHPDPGLLPDCVATDAPPQQLEQPTMATTIPTPLFGGWAGHHRGRGWRQWRRGGLARPVGSGGAGVGGSPLEPRWGAARGRCSCSCYTPTTNVARIPLLRTGNMSYP